MNELVKSQSSSLMNDYKTLTNKRKWELSYGYKDKFYLTEREKDFFIGEVTKGKDVVCLNGIVLTRFFKYLIPVEPEQNNILKGTINYADLK